MARRDFRCSPCFQEACAECPGIKLFSPLLVQAATSILPRFCSPSLLQSHPKLVLAKWSRLWKNFHYKSHKVDILTELVTGAMTALAGWVEEAVLAWLSQCRVRVVSQAVQQRCWASASPGSATGKRVSCFVHGQKANPEFSVMYPLRSFWNSVPWCRDLWNPVHRVCLQFNSIPPWLGCRCSGWAACTNCAGTSFRRGTFVAACWLLC